MKKWFLIVLVMFSGLSQAAIVAGTDYKVLPQAHQVTNPSKIEVLEFFSYTCSHCYKLDPAIVAFQQKLPTDVYFRTSHVMWGKATDGFARLLATMNVMKTSPALHATAFKAVMDQRINLGDSTVLAGWLKTQKGVDASKFMTAYNSFAVNTEIARFSAQGKEYNITGTPTVIVAGKYEVVTVGDPARMVQVINELIAKERQFRKTGKK